MTIGKYQMLRYEAVMTGRPRDPVKSTTLAVAATAWQPPASPLAPTAQTPLAARLRISVSSRCMPSCNSSRDAA